jgi:RHS repeat-associated protein
VTGGPDPGNYVLDATLPEPADFQVNQYTRTPFDARLNDRNGNLSRINNGPPSQRDFVYDYRNQMIEHRDNATNTIVRYGYDAIGRRIEKVVTQGATSTTTRFFYNDWQEIEEQNEAGATQATYVYGLYIDEVLNMQRDVDKNGNAEDYYYHTDDLYNVMVVTDSSGGAVERYEYGDYGQPEFFNASGNRIALSAIQNSLLLTGRRYDPEINFYYYRTRYLDSRAGRFLQRDLLDIWGDSTNLGNGYTYINNNPWALTDPFGKGPWYGNYCGPGNNPGEPIDELDKACKDHDACYDRYGLSGGDVIIPPAGTRCWKPKDQCDDDLCERARQFVPKTLKARAARAAVIYIFCDSWQNIPEL